MPAPETFHQHLARARGGMRHGFFTGSLGRVAALFLLGIAAAGLSDYLVGWETPARRAIVWAGAAALAAGVLLAWIRATRVPLANVAGRADAAAGHERHEIRAALDLAGEANAETGNLRAYLSGLAIGRAADALSTIDPRRLVPAAERRRAWRPALWAALALSALAAIHPRATAVVAGRLFRPGTELPPYSPFVFELGSEGLNGDPRVVYGKAATLAATVAGPAFTEPVELLIRPAGGGGEVTRYPTFRESGARHSRKLEGVTEPLDFAFAIGRARSAWRPLEVLYQPRLERAEVEVAPPAYAGLAASRFALGAADLRGLRGSRVRLGVSSNRPLSGGILEGRAPQGREVLRRVEAIPMQQGLIGDETGSDRNSILFEWQIDADLVWTLDLIDIRGGRMEEPATIAQRLIPDEKPKVDLVEPGPYALATPESAVGFAWDVEDDFGLDRLDLLRSAEKFRDRARPLPEGPGEKKLRLERTVLLSNLGVRPGQTLEFLIEARDRNPSLLGVGSSPAATVQVISEEEYAERIRLRTTLEEFSARYRKLREELEAALAAL